MATVIDELMITLGLDGSKARSDFGNTINGIRGGLKSVTSLFTGFTAGLTGLFAIQSQFSDWKTKAIEIQNAARSVNKTMEEVQAWGRALGKYGGSIDSFTSSVRHLNGELVKMSATGVSRAGRILSEGYGIDVGAVGRLRAVDDVMGDIADVMKGMSVDEAMGLGAKIGMDTSMVQVLRQGREAYKDLIEQKKRDAIYTEDDAKTVREYNAAMKQVKIGVARVSNVLFRLIVPAFTEVTKVVGDFVKYLSQHETAVKAFFVMLSGLITGLLLPSILSFFGALLTNPITWVVMLLAGIALAIEDLVVWAEGGESALGDLWTAIFGSPEEAKQTFEDVKQTLVDVWETVQSLIKSFKEWWQTLGTGDKIFASILPIGMMLELGRLAIDAFIEYAIGKFGEFCDWVNEQFTAIGEWIDGVLQSMSDTASSVVSAIEDFFAGLRDSIMSFIGEAIDWALGKLAELAAAVKSVPIIGGAIDYVTGGSGGTTNNTVSSKYNVVVNTRATDAEGTGRAVNSALMGYNARMANGGSY